MNNCCGTFGRRFLIYGPLLFCVLVLSIRCSADPDVGESHNSDVKRKSLPLSNSSIESLPAETYLENARRRPFDKSALSRGERKISTDLLSLIRPDLFNNDDSIYGLLTQSGPSIDIEGSSLFAETNLVYVYVHLYRDAVIDAVDSFLSSITDVDEEEKIVVAYVDVARLSQLAEQVAVRTVRKVVPPKLNAGDYMAEGDAIHRSDLVRLGFENASGAGIVIGVISDGVTSRSEAQATGDLPLDGDGLTVLSDTIGGDEGTAMLEVIHDIVPEAQLVFHDHGANELAFNDAIDELIAAGCNIIVDDVDWILEPYFEHGTVANHVAERLESEDIIFISSGGDNALRHHQKVFTDDGEGYHLAAEDPASSTPYLMTGLYPDSSLTIVLQWNEAFGASSQDYDLLIRAFGEMGPGEIVAESTNVQNGTGDPLEYIHLVNDTDDYQWYYILIRNTAATGTEIMEVYAHLEGPGVFTNNNTTKPDSIYGHKAVPGVITVGGIGANDEGWDTITNWSSQGPVTHLNEIISKPDICGIDQVTISGAGDFGSSGDGDGATFYGTSAAASHVAAIAAQLWGADPTSSRDSVVSYLLNSAVDIGETGYDTVFGYGRADAYDAAVDMGLCDDGCLIDYVCYTDGEVNPDNPCEICVVAETDTDTEWSLNDGESCEDGDPCTVGDTCSAGACVSGSILDTDGDSTPDCTDDCPNDASKTEPGICGCGVSEVDSDGDTIPDCVDECPNDASKTSPGICGCGVSDVDSDGDGTADCIDGCPDDASKTTPGICGCGVSDVDSDGDGTLDCNDQCPNDPNKTEPGMCGCGAICDACSSVEATLDVHQSQGRVHSSTAQDCSACWLLCSFPLRCASDVTSYYAVGSDEYLGTDGGAVVTLYSEDPWESWSTTECINPCYNDGDCNDGLFCNGQETCEGGACQDGAVIDCNDSVNCTIDICDESIDACVNTPDDSVCGDSDECTTDTCDPAVGCVNEPIPDCTECLPTGSWCGSNSECCSNSCIGILFLKICA